MGFSRTIATIVAFILATVFAAPAFAAPAPAPAGQTPLPLTVTPATVHPGDTIQVSISGVANLPIAGKTSCLGILGPGQNVELNRTPQFRPQIGTIAIGANGVGQASAPVPANLVAGSYRVILGGCSPHGNIAPLATLAQATITVVGPASGATPVTRLPATGGLPPIATPFALAIGLGMTALGITLRRRPPL